MSGDNDDGFDIDAGVEEIAESMGFSGNDDDDDNDDIGDSLPDKNDIKNDGRARDDRQYAKDNVENNGEKYEVAPSNPPSSWAKDQHDNWGKIPKEAQDYINLREQQMHDGIRQYKEAADYGQTIFKSFEPYMDIIRAEGVNEIQAISSLFEHHKALTTGSLEDRQQALIQIGIASGLIPQDGQPPIDHQARQLQQRLDRIEASERQRQQWHYQQESDNVLQQVNAFASDPKNQYFDELSDDIIALLQIGNDLQSAYDKAVWANPITRAKEIARIQDEQRKTFGSKQRNDAMASKKAAGVNVKSVNSNSKNTSPLGSWDDTMMDVIRSRRG